MSWSIKGVILLDVRDQGKELTTADCDISVRKLFCR
jgi:hypothetical protein